MSPDVEVEFYFVKEKIVTLYEGYRPAHKIADNVLTTGVHHYYEDNAYLKGTITFISPEDYPKSLWIGKMIEMYEGGTFVGNAKIIKIFNQMLKNEYCNKF